MKVVDLRVRVYGEVERAKLVERDDRRPNRAGVWSSDAGAPEAYELDLATNDGRAVVGPEDDPREGRRPVRGIIAVAGSRANEQRYRYGGGEQSHEQ